MTVSNSVTFADGTTQQLIVHHHDGGCIECDTCGCKMKRCKSIVVAATDKASAIAEGHAAQNCKICQSILNAM